MLGKFSRPDFLQLGGPRQKGGGVAAMDGLGGALPGAVRALGALAEACLGPGGGHGAVQTRAGGGGLVLSGRAGRLLEAVRLQGVALELLASGSGLAQHRAHGDGGLLCTALAARLAGRILEAGGPWDRAEAASAFSQCLEWCCEACGLRLRGSSCVPRLPDAEAEHAPLAARFRWNQDETLRALVMSVMSTVSLARLSEEESGHLSGLMVHAFAHAIPEKVSKGTCVRVEGVIGLPTMESHWVEGLLLDTPVCSRTMSALPFRGGKVALFEAPLDGRVNLKGGGDPATRIVPVPVDYGGDPESQELHKLLSLVARLKGEGVGVVGSQRVIHEKVKEALVHSGMLPLERLSARHADAVARCTGSMLLASTDPDAVDRMGPAFGSVGGVEELHIAETRLLLVHPPKRGGARAMPVATVIVGASNGFAMRELRSAAASALQTLSRALEAPFTLPGGGRAEIRMAQYIEKKAHGLSATRRIEALFMASALKSLARTVEATDTGASTTEMEGAPVLDLAVTKLSALTLAVDAAATIAAADVSALEN